MEEVLREEEPRRIPRREAVGLMGTIWMKTNPNHQGLTQASQPAGSWAAGPMGAVKDSKVKAAIRAVLGQSTQCWEVHPVLSRSEINRHHLSLCMICVSIRDRVQASRCNSGHKNRVQPLKVLTVQA